MTTSANFSVHPPRKAFTIQNPGFSCIPPRLRSLFMLLPTLALTGCHSIGPTQMNMDRGSYSDVIAQTNEEQILKNIVRIRYAEPVSYLKVTNVTASYSLTSAVDNSASTAGPLMSYTSNKSARLGSSSSMRWGGGIYPSATYSDSPTLSYVPIDDAAFVTAQQTPIDFGDLVLLFHGGVHDPSLLSRLVFKSIGNLDNASFAIGPDADMVSTDYQSYMNFVYALDRAILDKTVDVIPVNDNNHIALVLHFMRSTETKDTLTIKQLLGMPKNIKDIVLVDQALAQPTVEKSGVVSLDEAKQARNVVYVQFRSVLGIMVFLSHAVETPPGDPAAGVTLDANGKPFNWAPLMQGIMTIHTSDSEPQHAFVKTKLHNHWFYISDTDQQSEVTFTFVLRLMSLLSGNAQPSSQKSPVLTIPVR